jgi:hypothetical protein
MSAQRRKVATLTGQLDRLGKVINACSEELVLSQYRSAELAVKAYRETAEDLRSDAGILEGAYKTARAALALLADAAERWAARMHQQAAPAPAAAGSREAPLSPDDDVSRFADRVRYAQAGLHALDVAFDEGIEALVRTRATAATRLRFVVEGLREHPELGRSLDLASLAMRIEFAPLHRDDIQAAEALLASWAERLGAAEPRPARLLSAEPQAPATLPPRTAEAATGARSLLASLELSPLQLPTITGTVADWADPSGSLRRRAHGDER